MQRTVPIKKSPRRQFIPELRAETVGDRWPPDYPVAYDAGKPLHVAAKTRHR